MKASVSKIITPTPPAADPFVLAGRTFTSRLLVGTGKYASLDQAEKSIRASGAQIITVAVRRVDLSNKNAPSLLDVLSPKEFTYLPNSAGCRTAEEALRTLRLARELGGWDMVKLEVIGDDTTLYPDMDETLRATRLLVKDGFKVLAYTLPHPALCQRIEDEGAAAIMPLASPIGSGLGIQQPEALKAILAQSKVPVLVDAGIGAPSDATLAMEMGCAGVLMNTAIAKAENPVLMAQAMRHALEAGRKGFLAGRMPRRSAAEPSTPGAGILPA